jgi:glycerophosphoryl diester phosphodiesterase
MLALLRGARPGAPYLAGAPLLIAHRGGAALAPENTIIAFRQAIDWWGSDVLELDVQPTLDGEVVVLHDSHVDRTTDGQGAAAELTLAGIRELDAGYRYSPDGGLSYPFRARGIGVPTLDEVLRAFPGHRVNVEVKDDRAGPQVREVIAAAGAEGRVLVAAGRRVARRAVGDYAGPVSASEEELRLFYVLHRLRAGRLFPAAVDALQLPHRHEGREIPSSRLVRDAHRLNIAVHVWTVDAEDDMRRLLERGVDGIVTDRPDRLAGVLHERTGRPLPPGPPPAERNGYLERLLLA